MANGPETSDPLMAGEIYRRAFDAAMRGDRVAASIVFDHAAARRDGETIVLAYYAMAGPIVVEGQKGQVEEGMDYINEFMIPDYFSSPEELVPHVRSLTQKGLLEVWSDGSVTPAQKKSDIPIRAPHGELFDHRAPASSDSSSAAALHINEATQGGGHPPPKAVLVRERIIAVPAPPAATTASGGGGGGGGVTGMLIAATVVVSLGVLYKKYSK